MITDEALLKDARIARDVAALIRESIKPCEPTDLYFVCLNDESELTARCYERAADDIEAGKRKFWPDEAELEAARKEAWARLDQYR